MEKSLKVRVKVLEDTLKTLQSKNNTIQKHLNVLEDIEEIKILQRCYGYYYEHGMGQALTDLYADVSDVSLHWLGQGSFVGKENIKKAYDKVEELYSQPTSLHCIIQLSGIVHVAPDGKTAKGRWYGLGLYIAGQNSNPSMGISLYETDYLKQSGKWKIKMLEHGLVVEPLGKPIGSSEHMNTYPFTQRNTEFDPKYPSGYIRPFHFNHPVTESETCEDKRNATLQTLKHVEKWVKKCDIKL